MKKNGNRFEKVNWLVLSYFDLTLLGTRLSSMNHTKGKVPNCYLHTSGGKDTHARAPEDIDGKGVGAEKGNR